MANPGLEGGYTKISNELLEAACRRIVNSTWLRVLVFTMRLTYGWRRKEVASNYQAYATKLNLHKDTIRGALADMAEKKIITLAVLTKEQFVVAINKDYEKWKID